MESTAQLRALGEFMRARRSEIAPERLPPHVTSTVGRRRVKGLRREEVAQMAAVSTDYYVRLEQGRLIPSDQVFRLLCNVFELTSEQRAYGEDLLNRARGYTLPGPGRQAAHDRLQLLLDQISDIPALVLGPRMDVLAWNPMAVALVTDFSRLPTLERNYVSITFTNADMRSRYEDWPNVARTCVGVLRREAAENPDDPELGRVSQ